jgi:hypothetical protein
MAYAAYRGIGNDTGFSFEGGDEDAGILGTYTPGETPPLLTADTLDELRLKAWAHLGREPDDFLILTDDQGRVYEFLSSPKHREGGFKAEERLTVAIALLVFCLTCLIGSAFGSIGGWALPCFVVAAAVYGVIVRADFFNELEAAVICEIMLIMTLLIVAGVQKGA